ncbi:MAG TPA: Sec-independent protein translocase protein TatB [Casimicrobiaceae bacterium]
MLDISFSEIVVIGVVALVVIGPERLPKVARTLGHMFGRMQRYVNEVKADIHREIELDELHKLKTQVQDAARDIEQSVTAAAQSVESGARSVESELNAIEGGESVAPAAKAAEPPPGASADAAKRDGPQQAALPGFERI